MGMNLVEKIISAHLVEGQMEPGENIAIKIDQTLTQDATGTMAYLQFEALGLKKVKTELSVSLKTPTTINICSQLHPSMAFIFLVPAMEFAIRSIWSVLVSRAKPF